MTPENPIVGGTVLRIPAIQSPDFVHLLSGWFIGQDGSAEFNNLVIRGTIFGLEYELNANGFFMYSGTPAAGNLSLSAASAAGTDEFGNAYRGNGLWVYGASGSAAGLETVTGGATLVLIPPGTTSTTAMPAVFALSANPGAANEAQDLILTSGKSNSQADAALQLFSETADATTAARAVIEFGGTVALTVSPSGVVAGSPYSGTMQVKDGLDGQVYDTQQLNLFLPFNTATLVALTSVLTSPFGIRTYRIHGQLYVGATAGAQFTCGFTIPGATGQFGYTISHGPTFIGSVSGGPNLSVGAAVTLGTAVYLVTLDGEFTVPANTNMFFKAGSLTATGLTVNAFSFLDIIPV